MGKESAGRRGPLGKAAFDTHLARVLPALAGGRDEAESQEAAHAVARANQWVEAGDFLAAPHEIGVIGAKVTITDEGGAARPLSAGDVEQALGDPRRAVERAAGDEGAVQAAALWRAAREAVAEGAWEAAIALVDEGHAWLSRRR